MTFYQCVGGIYGLPLPSLLLVRYNKLPIDIRIRGIRVTMIFFVLSFNYILARV